MFKRITNRISKAIKTEAGLSDLTALLKDTEVEAEEARQRAEKARKQALDPVLTDSEADRAYQVAERVRFEADRLTAAAEDLRQRVEAATKAEEQAAKQRIYDAAKAARDATADKIRTRYPLLVDELTELAREIIQVSHMVDAANKDLPDSATLLNRPEGHARGYEDHHEAAFFNDRGTMIMKICRDMDLPDPVNPEELCWPEKADRIRSMALLPKPQLPTGQRRARG